MATWVSAATVVAWIAFAILLFLLVLASWNEGEDCYDGIDNDHDGATDFMDDDCDF